MASKRKARIIQTFDLDDDEPSLLGADPSKDLKPVPTPEQPLKFGRSKPSKSSSLRKSYTADELGRLDTPENGPAEPDQDDDENIPVVVRPSVSRAASTKSKKRPSSGARLSFGPGQDAPDAPVTPKKTLGARGSTLKHSLPSRFAPDDDDRPSYSKASLEELQSSTPATPQNLNLAALGLEDEMALDAAELDGALVVPSEGVAALALAQPAGPRILTDAEIREKKERRARLARESDFISLDDSDDGGRGVVVPDGTGRISVAFQRKKPESRLVAEDEDLGEGYDDFVQDGRLALGKRAEKDHARRARAEMAELIAAAGADSDAASDDDSEGERRAAYEAAQRRAGMDGLGGAGDEPEPNHVPRMKALPDVEDVLRRMRALVQGLEDEVGARRARIAALERERGEIAAREAEVQGVLDQAGEKYRVVAAQSGLGAEMVGQSPLRPAPPGVEAPLERGLESFGGTPTGRPDMDTEMG